MFQRTQFKLISSFVGVSIFIGGLSLMVGWQIIDLAVFNEAKNRISQDLNAAWEIYRIPESSISLALKVATMDEDFKRALATRDIPLLEKRIFDIAERVNLDFAGIVSGDNTESICRLGRRSSEKKYARVINPIAGLSYQREAPVAGTVILPEEILYAEKPSLVERAKIDLIPTPRAAPRTEKVETSGMTISAAIPIFSNTSLIGIIYGGILLNRSVEIVDRVRDTVFQKEVYKGKSIGTATIFFKDLRISTNVLDETGRRATGTRVSQEVKEAVLNRGERWSNRAFVVNDWFITAYDPIEDIFGKRVGILYVGVLEAKYADIMRRTLSVFIIIILAGLVVAIMLGYFLGRRILRPLNDLIAVSRCVSQGDLSPRFGPVSKDEIGVLQRTFREMLSSLKERDKQLKAASEIKLLQSEKQASVGRLAAGVAHEINNPLTGVLTFTYMLLKRKDLDKEIRSDLETIAQATERVRKIVKGLLDFSHQTDIKAVPTDINELIKNTLALVENQALVKGIKFCFDPGEEILKRTLDKSQIQSVLMNIIINAIDATDSGGHIIITTSLSISTDKINRRGIEIVITDTGHGILPENLDKLFDPFFTTKEVGKGTGLGLSVSLGIVERHGGTIRVKSRHAQGSTFIVWLPLDEKGE
ncbi:MAG TPA: cache domain-containing protein [Spirochaetia bacterium]|nr:cache domain-containing protein [Spirochaetia bacterium]